MQRHRIEESWQSYWEEVLAREGCPEELRSTMRDTFFAGASGFYACIHEIGLGDPAAMLTLKKELERYTLSLARRAS